ncbi:MAG: hypothetical protein LBL84_03705 [Candidatus Nomurabacteria bacterium]|jgi:hypothetical protein|nr:hypothetical protein [Candidatus Nomurabacteria bacterium]
MKNKFGKLTTPYGVRLEKHEQMTIDCFLARGKNVEAIKPSNTRKQKSPDVIIDGVVWEIKSPISSSRRKIEQRIREANKQSENIIFDLRRVDKYPDKVEKEVLKQYDRVPRIRRLIIIKKSGKMIDYSK